MKKQIPAITTELEEAVKTYLLAKSYLETIKPIIVGYQTEILESNNFRNEYEVGTRRAMQAGEFIKNPDHTFLMVDDDFDEYLKLVNQAHKDNGFNVPEGYCPLLVAKSDVTDAEKLILEESSYLTNSDNRMFLRNLDVMKKFIDTTVAFVLAQRPNITAKTALSQLA